ncbi:hypothetical protein K461DRAFT_297148 [Myriangium duriaei CBS 260.36]|uniref:NACHT domain-containing protein n=1 Tax=Myriangium duriaei CBS 260.36 TaxID=1168546 RepID=A0A9P4IVQ5_9PEZI|nr:hypothetical protein K461DRAFT_297148 [Myriangium duriaei CBS 260.36]
MATMEPTSHKRKLDRLRKFLRVPSNSPPGHLPASSSATSQASAAGPSQPMTSTATPLRTLTTVSGTCEISARPSDAQLYLSSFYEKVLKKLDYQERKTIEPYVDLTNHNIELTIEKSYRAAFVKQQLCRDKQWQWEFRGRARSLRDEANKVLLWLKKFQTVGVAVTSLDPLHIGLPWAAVNALLEVFLSDQEQMAALLTGMASVLYIIHRLQAYLQYLQHRPAQFEFATLLEESLIDLYAHVLKFLTKAIRTYDTRIKSAVKQWAKAFWEKAELEEFELKCEKLVSRVRDDIAICDKKLRENDVENVRLLQTTLDSQLQRIEGIKDSLESVYIQMFLGKLPIADRAKYGSYTDQYLEQCLEGTREDLIRHIKQWIFDPDSKNIFWRCGMAGTGKSTISRTIAETSLKYQRQGDLLTSRFFFKRGAGDRSNASRFFSTLALQFAHTDPTLRLSVAQAIATEPMIFQASLRQQMQELLVKPLEDRAEQMPLMVVILVDALDECESSWSML